MTSLHPTKQDLACAAQPEHKLSVRDRNILKLITSDARPNKALKLAADRYKNRRA
jgi:hypothetical protein